MRCEPTEPTVCGGDHRGCPQPSYSQGRDYQRGLRQLHGHGAQTERGTTSSATHSAGQRCGGLENIPPYRCAQRATPDGCGGDTGRARSAQRAATGGGGAATTTIPNGGRDTGPTAGRGRTTGGGSTAESSAPGMERANARGGGRGAAHVERATGGESGAVRRRDLLPIVGAYSRATRGAAAGGTGYIARSGSIRAGPYGRPGETRTAGAATKRATRTKPPRGLQRGGERPIRGGDSVQGESGTGAQGGILQAKHMRVLRANRRQSELVQLHCSAGWPVPSMLVGPICGNNIRGGAILPPVRKHGEGGGRHTRRGTCRAHDKPKGAGTRGVYVMLA